MESYIFAILSASFAASCLISTYKYFTARRKFDELNLQLAAITAEKTSLQQNLNNIEHEYTDLRDKHTQSQTNLVNLKEQYAKIEAERIQAVQDSKNLEKQYYQAQIEIELAKEKVAASQTQNMELEKQRLQAFKDAREAMFTTGREVFNKEAEEVTKKTMEQFGKIVEKVSALSNNVDTTGRDIQTVIRAMSSPAAVGQFSEIGLANILKEYGLHEGRDFIIQYNAGSGEGAKRPDAVLFIKDNIFIIDSKASKFFLELAAAENSEREKEALENIKKSMNLHLASLASKNYREAVIDDIRKTRQDISVNHVQIVMFLYNESHVNKILQADSEFMAKAIGKDIIISGPTGLNGLLAFARYSIQTMQREANQELLMEEVRTLLGSVAAFIMHAGKIGNSIKSTAKNYENLVASINKNLLPKLRKINKLGITMPANKPLPARLESFEINSHKLIEAGAVDEEEIKILELENT